MGKNEKIWAFLVHLGTWHRPFSEMPFDEDLWTYILDESEKAGINTIVLDIGGGIDFATHPELTLKGAWSRKRLRDEIKRAREKNIRLIPKFNFATPHDIWLGEYHKMVSTTKYYQVCNDLIKEAYELFEHPEYIHLGMDEEDAKHVKTHELATYRQGELYWHDLRYLVDCVKDTGAMPWVWSCPLFDHPEEYAKHFDADDMVLSPWYYNAFKRENWTPISTRQVYVTYYNEGEYKNMGIEFVEQDPFLVNVRNVAVPLLEKGYKYIPCASVCNKCDCNHDEVVEYFKENTPDDQLLGFITAPWQSLETQYKQDFADSIKFLKAAKEKFYK
ncbi:MAG: hypothetical protein IKW59_02470 [Clostridia bacterium]|nr:hypothetical protein [Clostridia bacterium]